MRDRRPTAIAAAAAIEQTAIKTAAAVEPMFSNSHTRMAPSVPMVTSGVANMRLSSARRRPSIAIAAAIHPPISARRVGLAQLLKQKRSYGWGRGAHCGGWGPALYADVSGRFPGLI